MASRVRAAATAPLSPPQQMQQPKHRRCVAIINPSGAHGRSQKLWQQLSADVAQRLSSGGFELEQCITSEPGSATRLAAAAAAGGAHVVLAVGGDGTIHEVVSGLVQQQQQAQQQQQQAVQAATALAVLPLGTGSDYARTYGWQLNDAAAACQRILHGQQQLTDVSVLQPIPADPQQQPHVPAVAPPLLPAAAAATPAPAAAAAAAGLGGGGPRYMVNVASCAVGALSAATAGRLKQLGSLCYPLGGALELLRWKGCSVEVGDLVCIDDSREWQSLDRLTTLVLGQGRFWGGGMQILPGADPTDGLMDVVALQGLGLWDFVSKGHLLRSGQHLHVRGVNMLGRCRRLRVRTAERGAALAWECDGEPQGDFEAVDISVLPGVLRVLSDDVAAADVQ